MKIVLELGQLEKEGLIKIKHVNYMKCDKNERVPTIGYLIEIKKENLDKVPENLKYNYEGSVKEGVLLFGIFI